MMIRLHMLKIIITVISWILPIKKLRSITRVSSGRAKISIISMDIDTLHNDVTGKGKRKLHDAFRKAQAEVTTLRKKLKNNRMKTFRAKKINNACSLIAHMKNKKLISEQVSEILQVNNHK